MAEFEMRTLQKKCSTAPCLRRGGVWSPRAWVESQQVHESSGSGKPGLWTRLSVSELSVLCDPGHVTRLPSAAVPSPAKRSVQ